MAISPKDFLVAAQACKAAACEAGYRSCASRAYYAVYHYGLYSLSHLDIQAPSDMGEHEKLIHRFKQFKMGSGSQTAKQIVLALKRMKGLRKTADYQLNEPFTEIFADTQLGMANQTLYLMDQFISKTQAQPIQKQNP